MDKIIWKEYMAIRELTDIREEAAFGRRLFKLGEEDGLLDKLPDEYEDRFYESYFLLSV